MVTIFIRHYNTAGGAVFTPNWGAVLCQCSDSVSHSAQTDSGMVCTSSLIDGMVAGDTHALEGILQGLIAQAMGAGSDASASLMVLASVIGALSASDRIPYLCAHYLAPASEDCTLSGVTQNTINAMSAALQTVLAQGAADSVVHLISSLTDGLGVSDDHVLRRILPTAITDALMFSDQGSHLIAYYLSLIADRVFADDLADISKTHILTAISESCLLGSAQQGRLNTMSAAFQTMSACDNIKPAIQFIAAFMSAIQAFMWRAKNETNNDV